MQLRNPYFQLEDELQVLLSDFPESEFEDDDERPKPRTVKKLANFG